MDKTCSSVAMGFEMSRKPNQGKGRFIQIELLGYTLNYVYICDGLNMLGPGSDTLRKYGLVGVDVALLEDMCHSGRVL